MIECLGTVTLMLLKDDERPGVGSWTGVCFFVDRAKGDKCSVIVVFVRRETESFFSRAVFGEDACMIEMGRWFVTIETCRGFRTTDGEIDVERKTFARV